MDLNGLKMNARLRGPQTAAFVRTFQCPRMVRRGGSNHCRPGQRL